ncbi:MAG: hypothetical protein MUO31_13245 [Thermodesulfovibrionales bacterium]|nr:hypothetical protein [Thermodesulfovibrionales bacterium]
MKEITIDNTTLYISWTMSLFTGIGIGLLCAMAAWYEPAPEKAGEKPTLTILSVTAV